MPTITPAGIDALMDKDGRRIEFHCSAKFMLAHDANSIGGHFLVSDDTAGYMPAGTIKSIAPPGEQRASSVVSYQQVDVDEGCDPA